MKCRYCRAGDTPNENGEHWIVKSILPARIDIRKCADGKRVMSEGPDPMRGVEFPFAENH